MKIAIAGGHGQIARLLTRLLSGDGHEVIGLIRNPDHADDLRADGAEPALVDLEQDDPGAVADAIGDADAVVFAAGAGPGSGAARKDTMDYGGAVKLIDAAKQQSVGHYVIVSSMGADPDAGDGDMAAYFRAKGLADEAVRQSGLPYTIVRPGGLTNDPGTARVNADTKVERGSIPRADVALTLLELLKRGAAPAGLTFELVSGDEEAGQAVARLLEAAG